MKLKGLNFKKMLLEHGEKVGFAVIGVVILLGLLGARWNSYDGYPSEMTKKVSDGKTEFARHTWPTEERDQFIVKPSETPKQVVHDNLRAEYSIADFQFSTKPVRSPYDVGEPLREPEWSPLQDAIANSGRVLIAINDPEAERLFEEQQQNQPLDPDGSDPTAPSDESIRDEFLTRRPATPTLEGGGLPGTSLGHGGEGGPAGGHGGARGAAGGAGGGHAAGGGGGHGGGAKRGRGRGRSGGNSLMATDAADASAGMAEMMAGGMGTLGSMYGGGGMFGSGLAATQMGRGFHYVSVRAIFPIRDQLSHVAKATNLPQGIAAQVFEILDYEIERQTLQPATNTWSEWEPVDISVTRDVLEKISIGPEADVVASQVTDPAMTMPLPARISGLWRRDATHPRISKFTLTPEQIQQEREFNELMIKKLEDEQKDLPPPPAAKKGWSDIQASGNALRSAAFGGGGEYGEMVGMGGLSGMGSMATNMASSSMAMQNMYGRRGGSQAGHGGAGMTAMAAQGGMLGAGGMNAQGKDQLKELLEKAPEERRKALEKYITEMATVRGELLLFRYIDFSVEPGQTYRYRMRLTFRNPNFGRKAAEAGNDQTVVEGETRKSEWSEPTAPTYVEKDQRYYVTDVKSSPGKAFPTPRLNVFQWDTTLGSLQNAAVDVALGQTIGGKAKTKVLDPAKSTFEEKDYVFQSNDFAVDALPDISIDSAAHPELSPPGGGSRGDLKLNEQVLVATSEGRLAVIDPVALKAQEEEQKSNYKLQSENYSYLEQSNVGSGLGGDLGIEGPAGMADMIGEMRQMYMRGANPLSKKGKGGRNRRGPSVIEQ
jgi:hypothetical protein